MGKPLGVALGALALALSFQSGASAAQDAISPKEAATWLKEKKDVQVIDVRSAAEYAEGHLAQAKLIPLPDLEDRLAEIDKRKPILLYCRSGGRSGSALKTLHDMGYTQAKHIEGGLSAWQAAGLPVTK